MMYSTANAHQQSRLSNAAFREPGPSRQSVPMLTSRALKKHQKELSALEDSGIYGSPHLASLGTSPNTQQRTQVKEAPVKRGPGRPRKIPLHVATPAPPTATAETSSDGNFGIDHVASQPVQLHIGLMPPPAPVSASRCLANGGPRHAFTPLSEQPANERTRQSTPVHAMIPESSRSWLLQNSARLPQVASLPRHASAGPMMPPPSSTMKQAPGTDPKVRQQSLAPGSARESTPAFLVEETNPSPSSQSPDRRARQQSLDPGSTRESTPSFLFERMLPPAVAKKPEPEPDSRARQHSLISRSARDLTPASSPIIPSTPSPSGKVEGLSKRDINFLLGTLGSRARSVTPSTQQIPSGTMESTERPLKRQKTPTAGDVDRSLTGSSIVSPPTPQATAAPSDPEALFLLSKAESEGKRLFAVESRSSPLPTVAAEAALSSLVEQQSPQRPTNLPAASAEMPALDTVASESILLDERSVNNIDVVAMPTTLTGDTAPAPKVSRGVRRKPSHTVRGVLVACEPPLGAMAETSPKLNTSASRSHDYPQASIKKSPSEISHPRRTRNPQAQPQKLRGAQRATQRPQVSPKKAYCDTDDDSDEDPAYDPAKDNSEDDDDDFDNDLLLNPSGKRIALADSSTTSVTRRILPDPPKHGKSKKRQASIMIKEEDEDTMVRSGKHSNKPHKTLSESGRLNKKAAKTAANSPPVFEAETRTIYGLNHEGVPDSVTLTPDGKLPFGKTLYINGRKFRMKAGRRAPIFGPDGTITLRTRGRPSLSDNGRADQEESMDESQDNVIEKPDSPPPAPRGRPPKQSRSSFTNGAKHTASASPETKTAEAKTEPATTTVKKPLSSAYKEGMAIVERARDKVSDWMTTLATEISLEDEELMIDPALLAESVPAPVSSQQDAVPPVVAMHTTLTDAHTNAAEDLEKAEVEEVLEPSTQGAITGENDVGKQTLSTAGFFAQFSQITGTKTVEHPCPTDEDPDDGEPDFMAAAEAARLNGAAGDHYYFSD